MKHVIYSTEIDTSEEAMIAYCKDYGYCLDDVGEQFITNMLYDDNANWFECEQSNLFIHTTNPIICIADLGLWNGRRQGYKILGNKISDIFSCTTGDFVTFFADSYNVHCEDSHHDGTNYYLFRELKGSPDECWPLIEAIYNGQKISNSLLNRYSYSIVPYVSKIYGWKYAGKRRELLTK